MQPSVVTQRHALLRFSVVDGARMHTPLRRDSPEVAYENIRPFVRVPASAFQSNICRSSYLITEGIDFAFAAHRNARFCSVFLRSLCRSPYFSIPVLLSHPRLVTRNFECCHRLNRFRRASRRFPSTPVAGSLLEFNYSQMEGFLAWPGPDINPRFFGKYRDFGNTELGSIESSLWRVEAFCAVRGWISMWNREERYICTLHEWKLFRKGLP